MQEMYVVRRYSMIDTVDFSLFNVFHRSAMSAASKEKKSREHSRLFTYLYRIAMAAGLPHAMVARVRWEAELVLVGVFGIGA